MTHGLFATKIVLWDVTSSQTSQVYNPTFERHQQTGRFFWSVFAGASTFEYKVQGRAHDAAPWVDVLVTTEADSSLGLFASAGFEVALFPQMRVDFTYTTGPGQHYAFLEI